MSPKAATRRSVPQHRSSDYWKVASHLMASARALLTLGDDEYGNAVGICVIHAVISANDAVTIELAGVRSSGEKHTEAQRLLQEVVPDVPAEAGPRLRSGAASEDGIRIYRRYIHADCGKEASAQGRRVLSMGGKAIADQVV